jgi:hypothetical protein
LKRERLFNTSLSTQGNYFVMSSNGNLLSSLIIGVSMSSIVFAAYCASDTENKPKRIKKPANNPNPASINRPQPANTTQPPSINPPQPSPSEMNRDKNRLLLLGLRYSRERSWAEDLLDQNIPENRQQPSPSEMDREENRQILLALPNSSVRCWVKDLLIQTIIEGKSFFKPDGGQFSRRIQIFRPGDTPCSAFAHSLNRGFNNKTFLDPTQGCSFEVRCYNFLTLLDDPYYRNIHVEKWN